MCLWLSGNEIIAFSADWRLSPEVGGGPPPEHAELACTAILGGSNFCLLHLTPAASSWPMGELVFWLDLGRLTPDYTLINERK